MGRIGCNIGNPDNDLGEPEYAYKVAPVFATGVMVPREKWIESILSRVSLGDLWHSVRWNVIPVFDEAGEKLGSLLSMSYQEHDANDREKSGAVEWQTTRRWFVEPEWTQDEVLRTVRKCALGSAEHRIGEFLTFEGERIYDPHRKLTSP